MQKDDFVCISILIHQTIVVESEIKHTQDCLVI